MPKYMLILHEDPARFARLSPSDMQAIVERYGAWAGKLAQARKLVAGDKLRDDGGRRLRRDAGGRVVSDGPYAEAKDVIGGFFTIEASSTDEAQQLASDCPHLDYGWIELREIEPT
jgi:hypothetical protein